MLDTAPDKQSENHPVSDLKTACIHVDDQAPVQIPVLPASSLSLSQFALSYRHTHLSLSLIHISFNNSLFARLTSPQLTSIDINSCQLGIEAAAQMISHIENPELPATKILVPHQLIERDSCARPVSHS